MAADGSFIYAPEAKFSRIDTFVDQAADESVATVTANVTISVLPVYEYSRQSGGQTPCMTTVTLMDLACVLSKDDDVENGTWFG